LFTIVYVLSAPARHFALLNDLLFKKQKEHAADEQRDRLKDI